MTSKSVFTKIYKEKIWGDYGDDFFSGGGSVMVDDYINFIISFINENNVTRVVDCGCGDFRIMNQITKALPKLYYHGIDIVDPLIDYNRMRYGSDKIKFDRINIIEKELPSGDLMVIKQVCQHLSNSQILKILKKLKKYKFVLISEHLPKGNFQPNIDKWQGPGIRLDKNSGVLISEPPFNINCELVLSIDQPKHRTKRGEMVETCVNTYLMRNFD